MQTPHDFGGHWTSEKLERIRKYLVAYTTIMNKYNFRFAYIDAFAGTGYRTLHTDEQAEELMFPEIVERETQQFLDGSARIALQVQPAFQQYIFIEKDQKRVSQLEKLRTEFPNSAIIIENEDANIVIQRLCAKNWSFHRAVIFLDPYGMQVEWKTIEAIAGTKAIDLWILFPLGVAVNRLLRRDGNIDPAMRARLDMLFGTSEWYERFYRKVTTKDLFGEETRIEKTGNFDVIGSFFVERLKTIFAGVADNPLPLYNSTNVPIYLLCFACGNPKGCPTAKRIAQDILRK